MVASRGRFTHRPNPHPAHKTRRTPAPPPRAASPRRLPAPHFCPAHGLVVAATTVAAARAACGMVTLGGMRWRLARRPPPPLPSAGERRTNGRRVGPAHSLHQI